MAKDGLKMAKEDSKMAQDGSRRLQDGSELSRHRLLWPFWAISGVFLRPGRSQLGATLGYRGVKLHFTSKKIMFPLVFKMILGSILGHLGVTLGPFWLILESFWAILAPFWAFLGPLCPDTDWQYLAYR